MNGVEATSANRDLGCGWRVIGVVNGLAGRRLCNACALT